MHGCLRTRVSSCTCHAICINRPNCANCPDITVVPRLKADLGQCGTVRLQIKVHLAHVGKLRIHPEQAMLILPQSLPSSWADTFARATTWSRWRKIDRRAALVGAIVKVAIECAVFIPVQWRALELQWSLSYEHMNHIKALVQC